MAASDSMKEKKEKMFVLLEALRGRIRKLLDTGRVTDDRQRHCLAFIEMEASALAESRRLPPRWKHCDYVRSFFEKWTDCDDVNSILEELLNSIDHFLDKLISYLPFDIERNAYAAKECDLVGIDGQANKLLRWLTAAAVDNKSLRVMCIVGPTGVGKTTLAMELHRRLRCQTAQHFQCCAAASFSRTYDRCSLLLQSILSQLIDKKTTKLEDDDTNMLARSISECLQDKRMCYAYGYDVDVHDMEPLNDSDSERLLLTKAFGSIDNCPPDNLKLLCDEILTKCQGIPLFIIVMADWLKQHQQPHESSAVHRTEQVRLLVKQLKQSFQYDEELSLPSLIYLSMFPQGCVFDEYSFLSRETPVDWSKIFSKLVDKNIIMPVAENSSLNVNVDHDESCQWQVNPLMLQFFASKAAEAGFVFTSTTLSSATGSSKMTRRARCLALHHPDPQLPTMLQEMDLSHTRSLLISGAIDRISIPLDKFSCLVELDLQGWEKLEDKDMLQVCRMFMLRYLSIRNTRVSKLPPQIRELRYLRILDVSHTHISELPSKVSKLCYLEVLDLRGTKISQLPEQFENSLLLHLLVGDNGMINSDETAVVTKIPQSVIKRATFVHTLATVDLTECSASFLEVVGDKQHLRSLAITWSFHECTDGAYRDILLSTIQKLIFLRSLTIHCGLGCSMEFLGSLNDPPTELNKLKVTAGRFVNVPRWIGGLEELAFLQITICRLVPDDVKILANLKKLKRLVLGLEFIPEEEIVIECEGFKKLQRFCLDCPVPWLTLKQGAMPNLQHLRLKICSSPANQESAVTSGLTNLQSITEIVICYSKWCSNSSSIKMIVEAVRKQVAMHLNRIDLVINSTQDNEEASESVTKNECESEDVEAFDAEAESVAKCGKKDDFDAADEVAQRRATHLQSNIEEIECCIAADIGNLKARAHHVSERRTRYGVENLPLITGGGAVSNPAGANAPRDRLAPPRRLIGTTEPVGMDDAINEIRPWFSHGMHNTGELRYLAIVGFGGLGKTTLAKALYRKFGDEFDCRASELASQKFHLQMVLRSLVRQFHEQQPAWENIRDSLPKNEKGASIVVTTRFNSVAEACRRQKGHVLKLKQLSQESSYNLFLQIISANDMYPTRPKRHKDKSVARAI
ncbi:hypothetical protein ABZP36_008969 [Zizania latifolia]